MGESGEALRVDGQRVEEQESREFSTLTARIHSDRSSDERVLHSRRTLGFLHAVLLLLATTVETKRERRRMRATARKEVICEQRRGGEEGESGRTSFILSVDRGDPRFSERWLSPSEFPGQWAASGDSKISLANGKGGV
jgi:hypothetical protein